MQQILALSLEELKDVLLKMGEKPFRAKQIYEWLHVKKVADFSEMTNLSESLRLRLAEAFSLTRLQILRKQCSHKDETQKYLYQLSDGNCIETVLMSYHHGNSICISSQVGCRMGCAFCASTKAGFVRNLNMDEMLAQIDETERDSGKKVSSIVIMGIGEPLDNFNEIIRFLECLSNEKGRAFSLRHVTLSTCGLVPYMDQLAEKKYGLTLAISLHATDNEKRNQIMPINRKYPLEELLPACKRYFQATGRRITFEYSVIEGMNDSKEDAIRFAQLLKNGLKEISHINLIPVNTVSETDFHGTRESAMRLGKYLSDLGLNVTVRRTLGSDIDAACGQLRRNQIEQNQKG